MPTWAPKFRSWLVGQRRLVTSEVTVGYFGSWLPKKTGSTPYAGMSSTLTIITDAETEPPEFDLAVEEVYQVGAPTVCVCAATCTRMMLLMPTPEFDFVPIPQTHGMWSAEYDTKRAVT